MKILCTADLHIGRRPSRLPLRVDSGAHSCARAWLAVVDRAIAEQVDLVAIAGDLVDETNRFYEAVGPVEAGVRKLAARGIRTVAVAGNHDHEILPWLAGRFDREAFILLGAGGRWERITIQQEGRAVLHIDGWSFPSGVVTTDPLQDHPRAPGDGVPVLGLLHADLEQPGSRHAPVSLAGLRALPAGLWLLGHVHRPARHEHPGAAMVLYPGSPQAMDPGEPGLHGPWLAEIDGGGRFSARQLPLATVRYEAIEVDVEGVETAGELHGRVVDAVRGALERVEVEAGPLRWLSLRLRLVGRTPLHRRLLEGRLDVAAELALEQGEITAIVEQVEPATRPPLDLADLARGEDPPGVLARLIRNLDADSLDESQRRLLQAAVARAGEARSARPYLRLPDSGAPVEADGVRGVLREGALLLLDELLAGKEGV